MRAVHSTGLVLAVVALLVGAPVVTWAQDVQAPNVVLCTPTPTPSQCVDALSEGLMPQRVVAPHYPPIALAARIGGVVQAAVELNDNGLPAAITVCKSIPLLDEACRIAAEQWRFGAAGSADGRRRVLITCVFAIATTEENVFLPPTTVEVRTVPKPMAATQCPPAKKRR